jgi:hypothetical protein
LLSFFGSKEPKKEMELQPFLELIEKGKEPFRPTLIFYQMFQLLCQEKYDLFDQYVQEYGMELFSDFLRTRLPYHEKCPLYHLPSFIMVKYLFAKDGVLSVDQCLPMTSFVKQPDMQDLPLVIGISIVNHLKSFWKVCSTHPEISCIDTITKVDDLLLEQRDFIFDFNRKNIFKKLQTLDNQEILNTTRFTSLSRPQKKCIQLRFYDWLIIEQDYFQVLYETFIRSGLANCEELSVLAFYLLRNHNLHPNLRSIKKGDHAFVIYGNCKEKNKHRYLCDAWSGKVCHYDESHIKNLVTLTIPFVEKSTKTGLTRSAKRRFNALCDLDPMDQSIEGFLPLEYVSVFENDALFPKVSELHKLNKLAL